MHREKEIALRLENEGQDILGSLESVGSKANESHWILSNKAAPIVRSNDQ
jgi:hypothetical protein